MRLPIMAGQFYPAQKQKLKFLIKEELKSVKNNIPEPKILILPHAGYSFCGEVMAAGFKQVQNKNINRVIIIAPYIELLTESALTKTKLGPRQLVE